MNSLKVSWSQPSLFDVDPASLEASPAYLNPLHWREDDWQQDNPKHFETSIDGRPSRCSFCEGKNHRDNKGATWIYPGCSPTTTDPSYGARS